MQYQQTESGLYVPASPKKIQPKKTCDHRRYSFDKGNPAVVRCLDCGKEAVVNVLLNPNYNKKQPRNAPCRCGSGKKAKRCCG